MGSIIFSTPMAMAIRKGIKTMTSRKSFSHQPGDVLLVKEPWLKFETYKVETEKKIFYEIILPSSTYEGQVYHMLTGEQWKPAILMPYCPLAMRIIVKNVYTKRIRDYTREDLDKEAIPYIEGYPRIILFQDIIRKLNHSKFAVNNNTELYVIEFELYDPKKDPMSKLILDF